MRRLHLTLILCLVSFVLAAQQAQTQARVPQSLECDFIQTVHMKMLKQDAVSYGHLSFRYPDKLKWEYTAPMQFAMVMDGQSFSVIRDGKTMASNSDQKNLLGGITKMMIGLSSQENAQDDSFTTTVQEEGKVKVVTVVPKNKHMQRFMSEMKMYYDTDSDTMLKIMMLTKSGDCTTIEFKNVRKTL